MTIITPDEPDQNLTEEERQVTFPPEGDIPAVDDNPDEGPGDLPPEDEQ